MKCKSAAAGLDLCESQGRLPTEPTLKKIQKKKKSQVQPPPSATAISTPASTIAAQKIKTKKRNSNESTDSNKKSSPKHDVKAQHAHTPQMEAAEHADNDKTDATRQKYDVRAVEASGDTKEDVVDDVSPKMGGEISDTATATGSSSCSVQEFMAAWAWKREHLPDKLRFRKPYKYPLDPPLQASTGRMHALIAQQQFLHTGFASTVWDSSIVVSKMLEAAGEALEGTTVCDLSAGTGLVGVVAGMLGAHVCATDLPSNLPLLRRNINANGVEGSVRVEELTWGEEVAHVGFQSFDLVVACDVMYIVEAVRPLVDTLKKLLKPEGSALVAHGRNCCAEEDFIHEAQQQGLSVVAVARSELHACYWAPDVTVLRLRPQCMAK